MNERENPWTIRSQYTVYENPWIKLTEFQVLNPAGGEGIYGKVHYKNVAIGIIVLDEVWNTWLVGQYRFPLNQYSWEIPEGGAPLEEDTLSAAKRELLEETGLVAHEWTKIRTMYLSNSVSDEKAIIYLARNLEQKQPEPEETEQLVIRKLSFDDLVKMVENEEITDTISVVAVQQIQLMIFQNKIKKTV